MKLIDRPRITHLIAQPPDQVPDWPAGWIVLLPALLVAFQSAPVLLLVMGIRLRIQAIFGSAILGDVLIVGVAWLCLCRAAGKSLRSLGLGLPERKLELLWRPIQGGLLAVTALYLSTVAYTLLSGGHPPPEQGITRVLERLEGLPQRSLAFVAVGLAAPIAEEITFRGVAFRALRWRMGRMPALVLSAALFSIAHLDLSHALQIFSLGLVLAWLVDRSGSLYPSMILHSAINLGTLFLG